MIAGQLALLAAMVAAGLAAVFSWAGADAGRPRLRAAGLVAGLGAGTLLTAVGGLLAWALVVKDFRFAYVAEYSDRLLPWHYSLSALWVGQAGSLLLWAWMLALVAAAFRLRPGAPDQTLRQQAFGVMMGYLCFLVGVMAFAADPMEPNLVPGRDGGGLSPLLQHPAMLLHPPVVFLGYAGWTVPFALAVAAMLTGRLDAAWIRHARAWSLFSWAVLGLGILLGADWAYEELGWGGYWSWDPVENGSLIPWLTGTALIHACMAWQHRGLFKKTALALSVATFALCNFASFLTRSGIFSSLHAFSESPLGWMFLGLMTAMAVGGAAMLVVRRKALAPGRALASLWTRESMVALSMLALLLLAAVAIVGTLALPLSKMLLAQPLTVGEAFYNRVLIPVGLVLLATTAAAPLLRWGKPPPAAQRRALAIAPLGGLLAAAGAWTLGVRHPLGLTVAAAAALALFSLTAALALDVSKVAATLRLPSAAAGAFRLPFAAWTSTLALRRRQYAGFLIHLGFICLAIGITGTSLGSRRHEVVLAEGQSTQWAGRSIRFVRLTEREQPDKLVVAAELEVRGDAGTFILFPAQNYYRRQNAWTTEVDIHSTWTTDFYAILQASAGRHRASFTFLDNPLIRWMWASGAIVLAGALLALWPARRQRPSARPPQAATAEKPATVPPAARRRTQRPRRTATGHARPH